jgi:hypothetical protein
MLPVDYDVTIWGRKVRVKATNVYKARTEALKVYLVDQTSEDKLIYTEAFLRDTAIVKRVTIKTRRAENLSSPKICELCKLNLVESTHPYLDPQNSHAKYCKECRQKIRLSKQKTRSEKVVSSVGTERSGSSGYVGIVTRLGKWTPKHKVVMEAALGRKLKPREAVHHINANRADNRPENLELWVRTHPSGARARDLVCPHCGKSYLDILPDYLSLSSKGGIYISSTVKFDRSI